MASFLPSLVSNDAIGHSALCTMAIFRRRVAKRLLVVSQSSNCCFVVVVVRSFQLFLLLSVIITAEMDSLGFLRVP